MQTKADHPGRILANKTGMMIGVRIVRETAKRTLVRYIDTGHEVWISKTSAQMKLCQDTDQAMAWIEGDEA